MHEAVSDILDLRMRGTQGFPQMFVVSVAAHAALLVAIVLAPGDWRSRPKPEANPMFISLGGAIGPNAGGMTQLSGRSVQAVAPPEPKARVEPPPAAKAPEMPLPDAKPTRTRANPKVEKPIEKSAGRKPTTGPEVKTGDARVDTGAAPIPFGGLSTGGGGTGGVQINVGDFCCPEYIAAMNQRITEHWNRNQGAAGITVMKFVIQRDGTMTAIEIEQTSRNPVLDLESRRALVTTRQLPPLPAPFTRPTLIVYLTFEYKR
jgi:outer membrane biosynthesis protein TonB